MLGDGSAIRSSERKFAGTRSCSGTAEHHLGEGIAEGEIVKWYVQVGQQVVEEDEFVEIMTDKATVMITMPYDGVIVELRYNEGDTAPVESVIAVIETGGAGGASPAPAEATAPAPAPAATAPAPTPSPATAASSTAIIETAW